MCYILSLRLYPCDHLALADRISPCDDARLRGHWSVRTALRCPRLQQAIFEVPACSLCGTTEDALAVRQSVLAQLRRSRSTGLATSPARSARGRTEQRPHQPHYGDPSRHLLRDTSSITDASFRRFLPALDRNTSRRRRRSDSRMCTAEVAATDAPGTTSYQRSLHSSTSHHRHSYELDTSHSYSLHSQPLTGVSRGSLRSRSSPSPPLQSTRNRSPPQENTSRTKKKRAKASKRRNSRSGHSLTNSTPTRTDQVAQDENRALPLRHTNRTSTGDTADRMRGSAAIRALRRALSRSLQDS